VCFFHRRSATSYAPRLRLLISVLPEIRQPDFFANSYTRCMQKIAYTLSFENYLEMTSSRREKKDFKFAAISAITGFVCIAVGYILLKFLPNASFFPGGLLLATGLLSTVLAMLLGFLAKPKSSRPDLPTLRREYDLYHSDPRSIEFDEHGWRVLWYEGEDVRPWSCLREIHDGKTLLILGTTTTHYWLPKTVLERDGQLQRLTNLAEASLANGDVLCSVHMRPSPLVHIAARIFHNWRRQPLPRILGLLMLALVFYWILSNPGDSLAIPLWTVALVPFFVALCEAFFYLVSYYTYDWSKASPNVEIKSSGVAYRIKTVRWIAEYRWLLFYREIPGAFMLYFESGSFHLIPKRDMSPQQIGQFRQLIGMLRRS
jgi:hypothetical protein